MHAPRSYRPAGLAAALALALGASGCFTGAEHEVTPARPVIQSFSATPSTVSAGGTSLLAWTVTGATTVRITPGLGTVTGTGVAVTPAATTTYTLTATNAGGSSTRAVTVTVGSGPPAGLAYSANPATYTVGQAITPNVPSSTGGSITSYAVSPSLPAGLSLDTATGVISGTPTAAAATAAYVVTGSNASGSTTASLTVTVILPGLPTIVSFAAAPTAIAAGESSVLSWDVLGATLISIDNGIGPVAGTSTTVTPAATTTYRLSATNAAGTVSAFATVAVGTGAPASLQYSSATYVVGTAIQPNVPASTGGAILAYAVAPPLPGGLALDTTTGVISGTPTTPAPAATYVVTAMNLSGSTTASVILTVIAQPSPGFPVIRRFSATPSTIVDGSSTLLSWDVVDASTVAVEPFIGIVTGTEVEFSPTATTTFTLSATNAVGTTTADVTVTVTYVPPANLAYATNPATYTVGTAITPNTPSSGGGVVFSYEVAPALPAGLSLDATTGVVSGTPSATAATGHYTVTARNPGGSTTVDLVLTVDLPPLAIITQPADRSVLPPQTATFSVLATGLLPLTYQWRRNGADIPGATSASYTTPPLALGDSGTVFDVVVTDAAPRSITSAAAILTLRGFFATGAMTVPRAGHTATLLSGVNRVLVAGGSSGAASLASAELYDPSSGSFTPTGSMAVAREGHSAVELADGRVLVVGGCTVVALSTGCTTYLASAEIYDPATGLFSSTPGSMTTARTDFGAALVGTKVLVAGGFWYDAVTTTENFLGSAELFDPATGTFAPTSPMWSARRYPMTALLLDDTVLLAGGIDATGPLASAETYDPNSGAFVRTASMSEARSLGTATRLATGQVLVAGGLDASFLAGADRYDPPSASFAATGSLNRASALQTATLLDTGEVLVAGGLGAGARSEVYDPVSGVFTLAPSMAVARSRQTATLLPDGTVLVAGGNGPSGALPSAELWAPAR